MLATSYSAAGGLMQGAYAAQMEPWIFVAHVLLLGLLVPLAIRFRPQRWADPARSLVPLSGLLLYFGVLASGLGWIGIMGAVRTDLPIIGAALTAIPAIYLLARDRGRRRRSRLESIEPPSDSLDASARWQVWITLVAALLVTPVGLYIQSRIQVTSYPPAQARAAERIAGLTITAERLAQLPPEAADEFVHVEDWLRVHNQYFPVDEYESDLQWEPPVAELTVVFFNPDNGAGVLGRIESLDPPRLRLRFGQRESPSSNRVRFIEFLVPPADDTRYPDATPEWEWATADPDWPR